MVGQVVTQLVKVGVHSVVFGGDFKCLFVDLIWLDMTPPVNRENFTQRENGGDWRRRRHTYISRLGDRVLGMCRA
jgi:hypothetical protein